MHAARVRGRRHQQSHATPQGGDGVTQFGRALSELNIDIICANSAPAKGRVERANLTLQDRLVRELRLRGISTVEAANAFAPEFIANYNARFGKAPPFRSDPRSRPDQSTGYWLKNVFSTRAMSSGATTCPCPSSVCRSVWGMAAVIAFAARSKKSVGRPAIWGSVIGPSVVTRTD